MTSVSHYPRLNLCFEHDVAAERSLNTIRHLLATAHGYRNRRYVIFCCSPAVRVAAILSLSHPLLSSWRPLAKTSFEWNHTITDESLVQRARAFSTRIAWKHGDASCYQEVHKRRKHLIHPCTAHMAAPIDPLTSFSLYAFEFPDRRAYIGITCDINRRKSQHLARGCVAKAIASSSSYHLHILRDALSPTEAAICEQETILAYRNDGWSLLNRGRGGELGQLRFKYTYESMLVLAKKAGTRQAFQEQYNGPIQVARKRGWLQRIARECGWPAHVNHKWSFDACLFEARRFSHKGQWASGSATSYQAAYKHGWGEEISALAGHTKPVLKIKWTYDACLSRARQFSSRTEWQYKSGDGSYKSACHNGWLTKINLIVFGPRRTRWSAPLPGSLICGPEERTSSTAGVEADD